MHTKSNIALVLLFVLSLASFCYINFWSSPEIMDAANITEIISTQDADFNTLLPEFELLERLLQWVLPIIR